MVSDRPVRVPIRTHDFGAGETAWARLRRERDQRLSDRSFLEHPAFSWNHLKAEKMLDIQKFEHRFRAKPLTLLRAML